MKAVYVTGLFLDRNKTFFSTLCKRFRVITPRGRGFEPDQHGPFDWAEEVAPPPEVNPQQLEEELQRMITFTEKKLQVLFPGNPPKMKEQDKHLYRQRAHTMLARVMAFRKVAETVPLHAVITTADYDGDRRPYVLEAKRLGIPSLSIEHGFLGMYPARSAYKPRHGVLLTYCADYVNFENELEIDAVKALFTPKQLDQGPTFISLGTPQDVTFDLTLSRKEALKSMGLDHAKFTLIYMGSWVGTRTFTNLVQGQQDDIEAIGSFLKGLQGFPRKAEIQLVLKLHGPYANVPGLFEEAKRYLEKMAQDAGITIDLITTGHIREALMGAHLLVSPAIGSVLWEGFMGGHPGYFSSYGLAS